MKISHDDQYLTTVAEDASIILWKIQDKDGRGLKRDKDFGWAEEILITKSDLEEKVLCFQWFDLFVDVSISRTSSTFCDLYYFKFNLSWDF